MHGFSGLSWVLITMVPGRRRSTGPNLVFFFFGGLSLGAKKAKSAFKPVGGSSLRVNPPRPWCAKRRFSVSDGRVGLFIHAVTEALYSYPYQSSIYLFIFCERLRSSHTVQNLVLRPDPDS